MNIFFTDINGLTCIFPSENMIIVQYGMGDRDRYSVTYMDSVAYITEEEFQRVAGILKALNKKELENLFESEYDREEMGKRVNATQDLEV